MNIIVLYTENEKSLLKRISMKSRTSYRESTYYTLLIFGADHEEVCKVLKDTIEVAVEKSSLPSYVTFAVCQ